MAAQNKLFQRLIWLADTVYSAKRITMDEIDSRWSKSPYNDAHESQYGKRNFSRHKDTIAELFGIEIVCDRSTNTYSINDVSRASGSDVRAWIINTFALNNLTNISAGMRERVIFEEIPEGMRYLSIIINAMKDSRKLVMRTTKRTKAKPERATVRPLFFYTEGTIKKRYYF